MGLDQYLNRRIYIGANYEHNNVKGEIKLTKGEDNTPIEVDLSKLIYIEEEVGYWRKCNAIHKWFVDNVQEGKDDCGTYDVSKEELNELLELCKKVLATIKTVKGQVLNGETWSAENGHQYNYEDGDVIVNQEEIHELLPTGSGFFFGSTDYDMWYIQHVQETIEILQPIIDRKEDQGEYQYSSSW